MAVTSMVPGRAAGGRPRGVEDSGPDRRVRGNEQDLAARPAEGEVDGPGQADLADEISGGAEDLDPAERRRIDVARQVYLDSVGEPGGGDREQAPGPEVAAVLDVEGGDAVRPPDVIAARFGVGAAVGDVEGLLVGGEREPVGLVETVRNDR